VIAVEQAVECTDRGCVPDVSVLENAAHLGRAVEGEEGEERCGEFFLQIRDGFVGKGFAGVLGTNGDGPCFPDSRLPSGA
jgi:hypothetical protein